MKQNTTHAFLWLAILSAGCSTTDVPKTVQASEPRPVDNQSRPFAYGKAHIEVGQSKERVVEEIKRGVFEWHHLTLRISSPTDFEANEWILGYGAGGGAAPGSGTLILIFKENILVSLSHFPHK